MAALIVVRPGADWQSSGGLFDWTLEFLIPKLSDRKTAEWLRSVVDNNVGSIGIHEFPRETQEEIVTLLRTALVPAAERELPEGPAKAAAIDRLHELVDLTYGDR